MLIVVPAFLINSAASRWVISEQERPLIWVNTSPRRRSLPTATWFTDHSQSILFRPHHFMFVTSSCQTYWTAFKSVSRIVEIPNKSTSLLRKSWLSLSTRLSFNLSIRNNVKKRLFLSYVKGKERKKSSEWKRTGSVTDGSWFYYALLTKTKYLILGPSLAAKRANHLRTNALDKDFRFGEEQLAKTSVTLAWPDDEKKSTNVETVKQEYFCLVNRSWLQIKNVTLWMMKASRMSVPPRSRNPNGSLHPSRCKAKLNSPTLLTAMINSLSLADVESDDGNRLVCQTQNEKAPNRFSVFTETRLNSIAVERRIGSC